jgi:regulatory protein
VHGLSLEGEELRQLAESELQRAHAVWTRKFDGPPTDSSSRASQVRFLMQRGFSSEVIRRVLKGEGADELD